MTGGDARPTLWRGRPRPGPGLRLRASFRGTTIVEGSVHTGIPQGANPSVTHRRPGGFGMNDVFQDRSLHAYLKFHLPSSIRGCVFHPKLQVPKLGYERIDDYRNRLPLRKTFN